MKKIPLTQLKQIICENIEDINSMDGKTIPAVLAELQGEQAQIEGIHDHRTVTEISLEALERVFQCWMILDGYTIITDFMDRQDITITAGGHIPEAP